MIPIDWSLWEPLAAGVVVSLIHKFIINNQALLTCCQKTCCEKEDIDARHNAENGIITTSVEGMDATSSNDSGGHHGH